MSKIVDKLIGPFSTAELKTIVNNGFPSKQRQEYALRNKYSSTYSARWMKGEIVAFLDSIPEEEVINVFKKASIPSKSAVKEEVKAPETVEKPIEEIIEDDNEIEKLNSVVMELGKDRVVSYTDIKNQLKSYLSRSIDEHLFAYCHNEVNLNLLLVGDSGTGKTESALNLAMKRQQPCLLVSMTSDNSLKDYLVRRELENNCTVTIPGIFVDLLQRPSTIILDELNMLPAKALAKLHEIMNRGGRVYLPELDKVVNRHSECVIIGTMNQKCSKYQGTNELNAALLCREHLVYIMPDFTQDEIKRITNCTADEAKFFCALRTQFKKENKRAIVDIRSMINFKKQEKMFGLRTAIGFFVDRLTVMDSSVRETTIASATQALIE